MYMSNKWCQFVGPASTKRLVDRAAVTTRRYRRADRFHSLYCRWAYVCWRMLTYADVSQEDIVVQIGSTGSIVSGVHISVIYKKKTFILCPNVCMPCSCSWYWSIFLLLYFLCYINYNRGEISRYDDVCLPMLAYADVCWRMLTYADVCWRMLTYADVCWRITTIGGRYAAENAIQVFICKSPALHS
jgi:hypothetical protein